MTKETFLLLTSDEMSQIAQDCRGVEGEHFLPHLYGNAVQMAVLKKNGIEPETLKSSNENDWQKVPENWPHTHCPDYSASKSYIDVRYRHGGISEGYADMYGAYWRQDNYTADIVAWRLHHK